MSGPRCGPDAVLKRRHAPIGGSWDAGGQVDGAPEGRASWGSVSGRLGGLGAALAPSMILRRSQKPSLHGARRMPCGLTRSVEANAPGECDVVTGRAQERRCAVNR